MGGPAEKQAKLQKFNKEKRFILFNKLQSAIFIFIIIY